MVSPGLILECALVPLAIVIAPFVPACCSGDTRNHDRDQQQQAADDDEEQKQQMASVAMSLLDWVTYSQAGGRSVEEEEDCPICLGQLV